MPRRDGTGPMGAGSMTGRGLGLCTGANTVKYGAGLGMGLGLGLACRRGFGRGFGRGFAVNQNSSRTQKELLQEQKNVLKSRLDVIDKIGGVDYELVLTTRATKEIAGRYGGLENLGDKLMKSENFEMAIEEIVWLISLLANQSILIYNLKHKDKPKDLLTAEEVELLTVPSDLAEYKTAITEALYKGTKRNIESENDPKNAVVE